MADMEDARTRANRAKTNFAALKFAISNYRRMHPNNETVEIQRPTPTEVRLVARIKQRPPRQWGLAAGDILTDLRCALDYAVYALAATHSAKDPPDHAKSLMFPICETEAQWRSAIAGRRLHGVRAEAIDYIASIQPFGHGGATSAMVAFDELVGITKHRFIYVAWQRLDTLSLPMKFKGLNPFKADARHIPGELEDGAELIVYELNPASDDFKFDVRPTITTKVVIEPTSKGWMEITEFVGKVGAYTEHVLGELEAFLVPDHEAPPPETPIPLRPW